MTPRALAMWIAVAVVAPGVAAQAPAAERPGPTAHRIAERPDGGGRLLMVAVTSGDGPSGYAAVRVPAGPAPAGGWPVVAVLHAGFEGASVPLYFGAVERAAPALAARAVLVLPGHRGEALRTADWGPFEIGGLPDHGRGSDSLQL